MENVNDTQRVNLILDVKQLVSDLNALAETLWDGAATASALADSLEDAAKQQAQS